MQSVLANTGFGFYMLASGNVGVGPYIGVHCNMNANMSVGLFYQEMN